MDCYAQSTIPKSHKTTFVETKTKPYKVIGIKDGDTFVLLIDSMPQVVRLAHIDCPEKKQAFGQKAKQYLSDLCFGSIVYLKYNEKQKYDRNKRLIAEAFTIEGININQALVKAGLAWHYKKYSSNQDYYKLEQQARNKKVGLWIEKNPIAPWDFRKKRNNH